MGPTKLFYVVVGWTFLLAALLSPASACTGIRLISDNGQTVFGRSMEWGTFDLNSRVTIIPRYLLDSLVQG